MSNLSGFLCILQVYHVSYINLFYIWEGWNNTYCSDVRQHMEQMSWLSWCPQEVAIHAGIIYHSINTLKVKGVGRESWNGEEPPALL